MFSCTVFERDHLVPTSFDFASFLLEDSTLTAPRWAVLSRTWLKPGEDRPPHAKSFPVVNLSPYKPYLQCKPPKSFRPRNLTIQSTASDQVPSRSSTCGLWPQYGLCMAGGVWISFMTKTCSKHRAACPILAFLPSSVIAGPPCVCVVRVRVGLCDSPMEKTCSVLHAALFQNFRRQS